MLMKPDKSLVANGVDGLQATTVQKSFLVHVFESLVSRSALRGVFHKVPCLLPRVDSQTTIQPGRLAGNVLTSQTTNVNDTKPKNQPGWMNTNFVNTSGFSIPRVLFPCCPDKSNAIWTSLSSIPIEVNLSSILRFSPRSPPSTPSPARIGQTISTMPWFCLGSPFLGKKKTDIKQKASWNKTVLCPASYWTLHSWQAPCGTTSHTGRVRSLSSDQTCSCQRSQDGAWSVESQKGNACLPLKSSCEPGMLHFHLSICLCCKPSKHVSPWMFQPLEAQSQSDFSCAKPRIEWANSILEKRHLNKQIVQPTQNKNKHTKNHKFTKML